VRWAQLRLVSGKTSARLITTPDVDMLQVELPDDLSDSFVRDTIPFGYLPQTLTTSVTLSNFCPLILRYTR
jgi:hypothetical protein